MSGVAIQAPIGGCDVIAGATRRLRRGVGRVVAFPQLLPRRSDADNTRVAESRISKCSKSSTAAFAFVLGAQSFADATPPAAAAIPAIASHSPVPVAEAGSIVDLGGPFDPNRLGRGQGAACRRALVRLEGAVSPLQMPRMPVEPALPEIQHPHAGGVIDWEPHERVGPHQQRVAPPDGLKKPPIHRGQRAGDLRRFGEPEQPRAR